MENNKKLNIVMFPWLAFGHIIPFLELSKQLALRGHHIYFVSAPRNLERLPKIPQHLSPLITLVLLPLPRVGNLPPNVEATTDVGFDIGADLLKKAYDGLQEPLTRFLESCTYRPLDWIIHDFCSYWLPPIADKLNIKKVYFSIFCARSLCAVLGLSTWTDFCSPPPWITFQDNTFYYLPHEARKWEHVLSNVTTSGVSDSFRWKASISGCDVMAVRSCMEIEGEYVQLAEKLDNKVVLTLGLLPPSIEGTPEDDTWQSMIGWLDKQRDQSVVYVALGSEFEPSQDQLIELALGLELSEVPFFWAFRKSSLSTLELPEGFEDRTRDRGMVWTSWVPQSRLLSHKSVGGFLTHCGWSSIIEALQYGKPLIMLPLAIDHGSYARFFRSKKVGIEIPRNEEDGSFTRSSVAESLTLVLKNEGGKFLQDEAQKLSVIFADKGLHGQYANKLIDLANIFGVTNLNNGYFLLPIITYEFMVS